MHSTVSLRGGQTRPLSPLQVPNRRTAAIGALLTVLAALLLVGAPIIPGATTAGLASVAHADASLAISAPWDSGKTFAVGNPGGEGGGYYGHCCWDSNGNYNATDYYAVDINGPGGGNADCGENVRATNTGIVSAVGTYSPGGISYIRIDHGSIAAGYISEYQHVTDRVAVGTVVSRGDIIAKFGNVGTTFCHLHFVVRHSGTSVAPSPMSGTGLPASGGAYVTSDNSSTPNATPRIATLDAGGNLSVKEGSLGATWTPVASGVSQFQLSPNRIAILDGGGNLSVKEGPLNAPWTTIGTGVTGFHVTDNRIGALFGNTLAIKEGPLGATWTTVSTGVTDFDLSPNRIAVLDSSGGLSVKEGPIGATWTSVASGVGVGKFHVTDTRVGVLWGTDLNIKDGSLGAGWSVVINPTADFRLSSNRIMARQSDGTLYVKEGAIGSSWTLVSGGADGFAVSDTRVEVWGGGNLYVKDGSIGATWALVTTGSVAGGLSQ
ncbi:MAG TPA: M23 family metallopeptidase [Candidatus Saccharimonadia bacterium]|nr:M23 family metallopeptidase [Candidatus Saccharimonadia bacterium]